jgi:hypothetical protein
MSFRCAGCTGGCVGGWETATLPSNHSGLQGDTRGASSVIPSRREIAPPKIFSVSVVSTILLPRRSNGNCVHIPIVAAPKADANHGRGRGGAAESFVVLASVGVSQGEKRSARAVERPAAPTLPAGASIDKKEERGRGKWPPGSPSRQRPPCGRFPPSPSSRSIACLSSAAARRRYCWTRRP